MIGRGKRPCRSFICPAGNHQYLRQFCRLKYTNQAKRERALAPTNRGDPPQAEGDQREHLRCETDFATDFYQYRPNVQLGKWQLLHCWHSPPSPKPISSAFVNLTPANTWGSSTSKIVVGMEIAAPGTPRMGVSPR